MATTLFSTLTTTTTLSFNPATDVLRFDSAGISAADVSFSTSFATGLTLSYNGVSVTLSASPLLFTPGNILFDDGSVMQIGDQSASTNDLSNASSFVGGIGDDVQIGFEGDDTFTGNEGSDRFYSVSSSKPSNDTVSGGDGADRLVFIGLNATTGEFAGTAFNVNADMLTGIAAWGNATVNFNTVEELRVVGANGTSHTLWGSDVEDLFLVGGTFGTTTATYTVDGRAGADTLSLMSANTTAIAISLTQNTASWGSSLIQFNNIENLSGGAGNDSLEGDSEANSLFGRGGNDLLTGLGGNDIIDGGAGTDIATYAGAANEYSITIDRAAGTATITDSNAIRDGADTLHDVEKVQFAGQVFDLFNPARTEAAVFNTNGTFLFDPAYYLLSHPALAGSLTLDAADDHYLSTGAALGYHPNTWFDPTYYENRWTDLKNANLDDATLFLHYNLYGVWEGRSAGPAFDEYDGDRYLLDNPDVAAYVDAHVADFLGSRSNGAIAHYVIYGANEGRTAYDAIGQEIESTILIGIGP